VVERWSANALQESTALEHAVRPGALFGQRLLLQHAPLNSPPTLDLSGDQAQATTRLTAALLAQKEWLPALSIGANRPITQASFTASGSINRTPGAARPLAPQAGFGGLLDAFGGGDEPAAEPAGHLTAEWIEYEIRSPGRAPERIRRDVFDLIGPSAWARGQVAGPPIAEQAPLQRAMALAGDTEVLVLASHLSREFVRHIANSALLTKRDTLRELVRSAAGAGPSPELTAKLDSVSGELYALALARTTLSPVGDRVFLDRPNVFSFHRRIRPGAAAQVVVSKSLDIVRNDVAVRSAEGQEVVTVRLAQGVADTAAEVFALGGNCSGCGPVANVSELRVSAEQQGDSWVSIHRLDDPAWREVTLDANARQRVEDDLRAGYVVLVPPRPVAAAGGTAVGWWRVDPRSGSTLGVMQSGHGQAMTELALQFVALGAGVAQAYSCMGGTVRASPTKTAVCLACGLVTFVVALLAIEGILAGATVAAVRGAAIGGFLTETSLTALCNVLGGAMK
jgi:hypothetical protein